MTAGDVLATHFCLNYIIHNCFMCRTLKHGCCHVLPWLTEISSVVPSCFMLEVLLIQPEGSFIPLVRKLDNRAAGHACCHNYPSVNQAQEL